jgi:Fe-S-cluster containining protein
VEASEKKPKPLRPPARKADPWAECDELLPATFTWDAPALALPTRRDATSLPHILAMDRATRELISWAHAHQPGELPDVAFEVSARSLHEAYQTWQAGNLARNAIIPCCAKGCEACCRQYPLGIHAFEVLRIYAVLSTAPDYPEILKGCQERCERFDGTRKRVATLYAEEGWDAEDLEALAQEHDFDEGHRCPFLSEEGACGIHAVRPITCRMFLSLSDPRFCSAALNTAPEANQVTLPPEESVALRLERLDRALDWWGHDGSLFGSFWTLCKRIRTLRE